MWKKDEAPAKTPATGPEDPGQPQRSPSRKPSVEQATIGRSITIKGEVTGEEDLLIQGRVDGSVNLQQHTVTVGPDGVVHADIAARVITVEGSVEGNLLADEQVILRSSARVEGDIAAPRVALEDGAGFRGGVDTGEVAAKGRQAGSETSTRGGSASGSALKGKDGRASGDAGAGKAKNATDPATEPAKTSK